MKVSIRFPSKGSTFFPFFRHTKQKCQRQIYSGRTYELEGRAVAGNTCGLTWQKPLQEIQLVFVLTNLLWYPGSCIHSWPRKHDYIYGLNKAWLHGRCHHSEKIIRKSSRSSTNVVIIAQAMWVEILSICSSLLSCINFVYRWSRGKNKLT
jgi:hypothetical protein